MLIYLGIATYAGERALVGSYGAQFAKANIAYFGALAYVYPLLLLYPLYRLYQSLKLTLKRIESTLALLLLFGAALLFQALVAPVALEGKIGILVGKMLEPLIGSAGVWLLLAVMVALSLGILLDLSFEESARKVGRFLMTFVPSPIPTPPPLAEQRPKPAPRPAPPPPKIQQTPEPPDLDDAPQEIPDDGYAERVRLVKYAPPAPQEAAPPPPPNIEKPSPRPLGEAPLIVHELEENRRLMDSIELGGSEKPKDFKLPPTAFLQAPKESKIQVDEVEIDRKIGDLLDKLHRFKIEGDVVRTYAGPVVTTFEFKPAPHVKVSRILTLEDDLAMALRAKTIRIQAPVPGKDVVGIEIPNQEVQTIYLREVLESDIFQQASSPLTIALGMDIVGKPFVTDLKKLPHLLIAGTTGSGKSVGINAMILSLLYRNSPDTLKLMMVDPKMLEFSIYNEIPHLLTPVITQPKQAVLALSNMVAEMERRYTLMSKAKTKNIENFNEKAKKEGFAPFPYIVVIIDELADLMMTSGKDVEHSIARLAQMARASGIHLIVATQRPSVDVVTGLIKANLPSRISYKVGSKIDSKVILDSFGAEGLLGRGDMLFTPPGMTGLVRLHAPWSSEEEIEKIVEFLKMQREPQYDSKYLSEGGEISMSAEIANEENLDELYEEARQIVLSERKSSISYIQRRLQIGYNRAARIVEQLEATGVLSAVDHKGNREIL